MDKPTVGRVVHFTQLIDDEPACLAAIITKVPVEAPEGWVNLVIFVPPTELVMGMVLSPTPLVEMDENDPHLHRPGTWHWPERG